MPISYEEQVGSGNVTFAEGDTIGERIFKVDWSDAFEFAKELYGRFTIFPLGGYQQPARFPYLDYLYCNNVRVVGLGKPGESTNEDGTYITYAYAKVTATYGPMTGVDPEDPEVIEEENVSVSAEMLTLEDDSYEFAAAVAAVPSTAMPGRIETTSGFSVTRYHVASLPDATIEGLTGKVNNATWRGKTAGYVLFAGADGRRSITVDGADDWEITYNFLVKSHSWNHVYRSDHGHYEAVRTKIGHDPIYEPGAFGNLGV